MSTSIYSEIFKIGDSLDIIKELWITRYDVPKPFAENIIQKILEPYFDKLRDDLYVIIEYPYVDKMYRDTYYHYYSSKLEPYNRDTIRISFFNREVKSQEFLNVALNTKMINEGVYLGFLTLRPTFPKVIGRTALSPKAKKDNDFLCCTTQINATANFIKYKLNCFPHSSQDNQTITCAETTIWSLLEYFGNKYPDYKPVLPSAIHKTLRSFSYKRLMPSEGLTAEQVTFAIREFGFGSKIYSRSKYVDVFETLISTYVESGIPIVAVLSNDKIGHAVNIIGRENENPERVTSSSTILLKDGNEEEKIEIIDFNKVKRKYVFIDDNYPPYQLTNLHEPCLEYYTNSDWHDCSITHIIVPLYPKVYLEANTARFNFMQCLKDPTIGIKDSEVRIVNIFLASSRSYKEYITLNPSLNDTLKKIFLGLAMPKFIWVAEISKKTSFENGNCDGIILQDATEPARTSDDTLLGNQSLIAGFLDNIYFSQNFGKFKEISIFAQPFTKYTNNLG